MQRPAKLLEDTLVREMHERGEFANTSFLELQMAGEPTIHPRLYDFINYLRVVVGVGVGLSTHGLNMRKPGVLTALLRLNALTISVDSLDPEVYHQMRHPAQLPTLLDNLDFFFWALEQCYGACSLQVDLQLVRSPLIKGSGDLAALQELITRKGWPARARVTDDSFMEMQGKMPVGSMPRPKGGHVCLNPFTSVSVTDAGDVVSCCLAFDARDESSINWYGNLHRQTLEEIWNGPRAEKMRLLHRFSGSGKLAGYCAQCYQWSGAGLEIHNDIVRHILRY